MKFCFLLTIVLFSSIIAGTQACSCVPIDFQTEYCQAYTVGLFHVISKEHVPDKNVYEVEAYWYFKNPQGTHLTLQSADSDGFCGVYLIVDCTYLLLLLPPYDGVYWLGSCNTNQYVGMLAPIPQADILYHPNCTNEIISGSFHRLLFV